MCLASEDDHSPVIQLWDLRYATSPVKTLEGHQRSVAAGQGRRCASSESVSSFRTVACFLKFPILFRRRYDCVWFADRRFPVSPVSFIALSQSYSLHIPLAHILPPCLWSPSLPFPRYRFHHHIQYKVPNPCNLALTYPNTSYSSTLVWYWPQLCGQQKLSRGLDIN